MARVRIEWVLLSRPNFDRGVASNDVAGTLGAQLLDVSQAAVSSTAAPAFTDVDGATAEDGFARVFALSGAVNLAWGASPAASESNGLRLEAGQQVLIAITTGQFISFVQAADAPSSLATSTHGLPAEAVSHSATLTAGGTAQDLMGVNAVRNGWEIQNQSTGSLWIRSKGSAGTTTATQDQDSLLVPPGVLYTADAHVTANALSIVGSTTGQAFYAREW